MRDMARPANEVDPWRSLARSMAGDDYAHGFAANFDRLAAEGKDVHGEASFVASLVDPPARVLDAGCGTGRVAARLAELGYEVAGIDADDNMIAVARERSPHLTWIVAGLADLDLGIAYDVVVMAGNVIPFVEPSTLPGAARRIAAHTAPGGFVACGFGFDAAHLPPGAPLVPLSAYDEACEAAGLVLESRFAGWAREPYEGVVGGYAVSLHRHG
jgi:2-polyprenyl-3-methyl-5-hydroxy-6-metoxy-1,4-benzoquinol methylase